MVFHVLIIREDLNKFFRSEKKRARKAVARNARPISLRERTRDATSASGKIAVWNRDHSSGIPGDYSAATTSALHQARPLRRNFARFAFTVSPPRRKR